MNALKKRRSILKGQLTKIDNFAENIDATTKIDDIQMRLDRAVTCINEFTRIEDQIFALDDNEPSLSEEADELYYRASALLNEALRQLQTRFEVNTTTQGDTTCQHLTNSNETTRLPRLNIPIFHGNVQEWQSFFDLFNSSVHEKLSLAAAQKLQYLKGCVKGEPLSLIRHLGITDANYVEAYEILLKRYNKQKVTINSYIETFFKQPHVTRGNSTNIRKLADTTEEILRGLKAIGTQGDARDPWLIHIIVNKLDDESRQFWQYESSKIEHLTIQNLLESLQIRADTLEGVRETIPKPVTYAISMFQISRHGYQQPKIIYKGTFQVL